MYSEHGLEALIRPEAGQVCQSLIVVSYWMPGSALAQAAIAIRPQSSSAVQRLGDLAVGAADQLPVALLEHRRA